MTHSIGRFRKVLPCDTATGVPCRCTLQGTLSAIMTSKLVGGGDSSESFLSFEAKLGNSIDRGWEQLQNYMVLPNLCHRVHPRSSWPAIDHRDMFLVAGHRPGQKNKNVSSIWKSWSVQSDKSRQQGNTFYTIAHQYRNKSYKHVFINLSNYFSGI